MPQIQRRNGIPYPCLPHLARNTARAASDRIAANAAPKAGNSGAGRILGLRGSDPDVVEVVEVGVVDTTKDPVWVVCGVEVDVVEVLVVTPPPPEQQ